MIRVRREKLRPGWHPDPTRRHQYREWDGSEWTAHVSDHGRASIDPICPVEADRSSRTRAERRRQHVAH